MESLLPTVAAGVALGLLVPGTLPGQVPHDDLEKIRQAAPADAPAVPKKARKLLVFSRAEARRAEARARCPCHPIVLPDLFVKTHQGPLFEGRG